METRSSRYLDENVSVRPKSTRTSKNRYLYDEVNNRIGYEEIEDFSRYGNVELDTESTIKTREDYKKTLMTVNDDIKEEQSLNKEERIYDINSVLEEARKNRVIPDEIEKKRKLQNAEYSILADLNQKYLSRKEKIEEDLEKEGIRELIDTITSKNLASDLKLKEDEDDDGADLMSELMATNTSLNVLNDIDLEEEIAKDILAKDEDDDDVTDSSLVNSFYTKSMDLTEQDFELKDEIIEENKAKRKILILVVLIIIVVIAIVGLFILKKINII